VKRFLAQLYFSQTLLKLAKFFEDFELETMRWSRSSLTFSSSPHIEDIEVESVTYNFLTEGLLLKKTNACTFEGGYLMQCLIIYPMS